MPPPDSPSTVTLSSSACISAILACIAPAFFIKPMMSIRNPRLQRLRYRPRLRPLGVFSSAAPRTGSVSPPRTATMTAPGNWSSVARTSGCACTPMRRSLFLCFGLFDKGLRAPVAVESATIQRWPVQSCNLRVSCAASLRRTAGGQRKFATALFEPHQPHVALERDLELDVALRPARATSVGEIAARRWARACRARAQQ